MYYLAVDIGASSGRHILCSVENHKMQIEEIYRFKNNVEERNGHFFWNTEYLFDAIVAGLKKCKEIGKIPVSMAIDTWGCDYVLANKTSEAYAYRDHRSLKGVDEVSQLISDEDLYKRTGIQHQSFNTIYQLKSEENLNEDDAFLMIPDYFNYLLTGKKVNEYTNMSTTGLLNIRTNTVDQDLLSQLDIPNIFQEMVEPGTIVGSLKEDIKKEVGFDLQVVVCASHDTGSAYMASVASDGIILSSGTWSLLGIESDMAYTTSKAREANFTNEGGYNHTYRFLKNIMGMWIIQEVARNLDNQYSFQTLQDLARTSNYENTFDVNKQRFLKPEHMITEIQKDFEERNIVPPTAVEDIAYCVFHSLALSYKLAIDELEDITGKKYKTINIIGGGCQNLLLDEMIAKMTCMKVIAGPIEATAIGNIVAQMIAFNEVKDIDEAREMIKESFDMKEFEEE